MPPTLYGPPTPPSSTSCSSTSAAGPRSATSTFSPTPGDVCSWPGRPPSYDSRPRPHRVRQPEHLPGRIESWAFLHHIAPLTLGCARLQPDGSRTATVTGSAGSARPTGGRRKQRTIAMITRTKLVIGTLATGLALAACGTVAGTSGQGNHGKPFAQHQVQRGGSSVDAATDLVGLKQAHEAGLNGQKVQWGNSGGAEFKNLAEVKRDLQRRAAAS